RGHRLLASVAGMVLFGATLGAAGQDVEIRYSQQYDDDDVYYTDSAPDVSYFYRALAPHGEWIQHPSFGWVWSPYDIPLSWRPYSRGHWANTDYGWTWVSDEPFGW